MPNTIDCLFFYLSIKSIEKSWKNLTSCLLRDYTFLFKQIKIPKINVFNQL